ncbi:unnamed protein product [Heligmosomoides polygyrus]|uniref:Protein kinase domain-containing protein n=1 Tax=Heligmosomoides polygyrus TaxID=6339 RepID=A0A183GLZ3_HELPZ|nr:unnamed protein product [Heligmosomoides polygyrus]
MKAVEVELTQGTVRRHASSVSRSAMPIRKREKRAPGEAEKRRKEKMLKREKLGPGATLQSDNFKWTVLKLLGSGGFGDVYKVVKEENQDRKRESQVTYASGGRRTEIDHIPLRRADLKTVHDVKVLLGGVAPQHRHMVANINMPLPSKLKVGPGLRGTRKVPRGALRKRWKDVIKRNLAEFGATVDDALGEVATD